MDLGIFLSAPVPKPWTEGKEERIYAQELDLAVRADAAGFGYCWMSEHHFLYEYCHSSSPEMQLAAIAARTKNIRIGHAIVDLQQQINHPIRVAERVATLDLISNGRVEFGSGKGSGPNEWIGFDGVPMEQAAAKEVWVEALNCILKIWREEEFEGWDGKHITIPGPRVVVPHPVQKPHPPLWMACTNPGTSKEAGERGVGALMFAYAGLRDIADRVKLYEEGWNNPQGRFSDVLNHNALWVVGGLATDKGDERKVIEEFVATGMRAGELFNRYFPLAAGGTLDLKEGDVPHERPSSIDDMLARDAVFSGSPERIVDSLHKAEEAGITQIVLSLSPGHTDYDSLARTVEIWGEKVIPEFAKVGAA